VQIVQGTDGDSLAVPQQAVQRSDGGMSEVYVVRPDNRAVLLQVRAGRIVDEQWQVIEGLSPGDRVVVEGFQKFVPGDVVAPVPWQATRSAAESSISDPERSRPVPVHYSPAR
jgi:membrane fusion protein (multidrug efflux system)